jgi:hypothetical protein
VGLRLKVRRVTNPAGITSVVQNRLAWVAGLGGKFRRVVFVG